MEDEMQMTIQSYMQIIQAQQTEDTKDTDKLTQEVTRMQLQANDN
jgi:hypothetical protein